MTAPRAHFIAAALLAASAVAFAQQPSPGPYSIRGWVVSATTGKPVDQAIVTISTTEDRVKITDATTGEDGSFAFEHLRAGNYTLRASRRGYNAASYDEHEGFYSGIVTGLGLDTTNIRFKLLPAAIISGIVSDDAGDPVRNAQVSLYRKSSFDGLGKISPSNMQQTDDIGAFEFAHLAPGDYFVSVIATPWYAVRPQQNLDATGDASRETQSASQSLDVAYPLTFYSDTTDSDEATPIPVRAGDHVQLNLSLRAVAALHLHIHPPEAGAGQANQPTAWPQITQNVFGQEMPVPFADPFSTSASGPIEVSGIPAGHYQIGYPGQSGSHDLDITADATLDGLPADPRVEVHGKVAMIDGQDPPAGLYVFLNPSSHGFNYNALAAKDGTFTIEGIPVGSYEVSAGGSGSYSVVRMAADGASIEGATLKLGSTPVNLAIVLTSDSATINGFARQNGKPAAGVMVVLVPRDPGSNRELFRRDESNTDGSFSLMDVAPGEYTLVAIDDGWSLDWARPEVIGRYLAHGLKLNVTFSQKIMNIAEPVEVQPRY
jgi:5-hydroxyisourate hydrolase-like protein (transthyretin family)